MILPLLGVNDALDFETATAGGDEFPNDDGESQLWVYNQGAIAKRVRFTEQRPCSYASKDHAASTVTIGAGKQIPVGKFQPHRYNNSFRRVEVTYPDGVAGLWVCAARRP